MIKNALSQELQTISRQLQAGAIGVLPTDTIYGLVAPALDAKAVERVYEVRKRRPDKPCIILIADITDISRFGIVVDRLTEQLINRLWPGAVSVVLSYPAEALAKEGPVNKFAYLHRGTKTLAFRLPADLKLQALLRETGPLIAPSANPEGMKPATTIDEAMVYFEDSVDFYLPSKALATAGVQEPLVGAPSTVVAIENGMVVVLRQGAFKVPAELFNE